MFQDHYPSPSSIRFFSIYYCFCHLFLTLTSLYFFLDLFICHYKSLSVVSLSLDSKMMMSANKRHNKFCPATLFRCHPPSPITTSYFKSSNKVWTPCPLVACREKFLSHRLYVSFCCKEGHEGFRSKDGEAERERASPAPNWHRVRTFILHFKELKETKNYRPLPFKNPHSWAKSNRLRSGLVYVCLC